MKYVRTNVFIVMVLSIFLSYCGKDADNAPSVEAEINGVKWRGNSTDPRYHQYVVVGDDNSKMMFWINSDSIQTFNFFSNASITKLWYSYKDTTAIRYSIGAFDSKLKIKLESTFENDIDRFEIELAKDLSSYMVFKLVGSIPATGASTTLKQYFFTFDNIALEDLSGLWYRIKIITKSGAYNYTPATNFYFGFDKALIALYTSDKKLYFALDDNQNKMSITSVGPTAYARTGTFSFNYLNEAGDTVRVKNGKFQFQ